MNIVHFPKSQKWIAPSLVAALTPGFPPYERTACKILLASGGEVYLQQYSVAETADMLGFAGCAHGITAGRCDLCYGIGLLSRASAIVDRNPSGGDAKQAPSRSDESGGAGTAIAQPQTPISGTS